VNLAAPQKQTDVFGFGAVAAKEAMFAEEPQVPGLCGGLVRRLGNPILP
jgi:hypothetical protein